MKGLYDTDPDDDIVQEEPDATGQLPRQPAARDSAHGLVISRPSGGPYFFRADLQVSCPSIRRAEANLQEDCHQALPS